VPQYDSEDTIWSRVETLAAECQGEGNSFAVILPFEPPDLSRPLYVLVHPGDVVQTRSDVGGHPNAQAILDYSAERQEAMADDVERLTKAGWDVAVLHRFSSSYGFGTTNTIDWFEDAVDEIHERGAVLFGDNLREAAEWLASAAGATSRPVVLLSGAWSSAAHGCVSMIGTLLEQAGATVHLATSACVSPDGSEEEWRPVAGTLSSTEALRLSPNASAGPRA
jgi:hypothetical protein